VTENANEKGGRGSEVLNSTEAECYSVGQNLVLTGAYFSALDGVSRKRNSVRLLAVVIHLIQVGSDSPYPSSP
jgi:hypothetical protein